MRAAARRGVAPRNFVTTTVRDGASAATVDLVERQFKADGADQLLGTNIPYVQAWSGLLYLAILLHIWSREIVG